MSNPEIVSQSKEPDVDRGNWKILLLGLSISVAGFFSFLYLDKFLTGLGGLHLALFILVSLVFFVLVVIASFLVKSEWKLYLISFFGSLASLAVFYDRLFLKTGAILAVGAALMLVFLNAGFRGASQSIGNSLRLKFFLTAKAITPKVVTGFIVFAAIIFFGNYFLWDKFNDSLGRRVFENALASSGLAFKIWLPESNFNQTVEQFLEGVAEAQLEKTDIRLPLGGNSETRIDFSRLAPEVRSALVKQSAGEALLYIESKIGPVDEKKSVREVGYGLISEFVSGFTPRAKMMWGLVLAILIFYAARSVAGLLYWIINGFSFIIFKLLIVLGFAYMSVETKTREFVLLK